MFDDPKKELERIQKELLAAQETPEEEDEDMELAQIREMLAREDWEEDQREPLYRSYTDWEDDSVLRRSQVPDPAEEKPEPRRPRYGLLLAVLFLETLALAVMAFWWYLWLK